MHVIFAILAAVAGAAFRGTAVDPAGAPVASARVSAYRAGDPSTAPAASAVTDQQGSFALDLPPGRYVVRIVARGGETAEEVTVPGERRAFVLQPVLRESIVVQPPSGYRVPVVTSATKTETPLRDVPQSVTVVTQ